MFRASVAPLLVVDAIVLDDFNGHNEEWSQGASDARGDPLAIEFDSNGLDWLVGLYFHQSVCWSKIQ